MIRPLRFAYGAVIAASVVAAWRAPQWRWQGRYDISGNRTVSTAAIERRLPRPVGRPLFLIDPATIRDALGAIPSLSGIEVRRWLYPARIAIHVIERRPAARLLMAQLATGSPLLYLDDTGDAYPSIHPLPVALTAAVARIPLSAGDRQTFQELVGLWPAGASGSLDLRDPAHLAARLETAEGGATRSFEVILGDGEALDSKFLALERILPLAESSGKTLEYVNVRFPDAPAFKVTGNPLNTQQAPSNPPSERHGQHGQGVADTGHRDRADGGGAAVDADQEPGHLRARRAP